MNITQVNYQDVLGGAEQVAQEIHHGLQRYGHVTKLYVGNKNSNDEAVYELDPDTDNAIWPQFFINQALKLEAHKKNKITHYSSKLLRAIARPKAFMRWLKGIEEFNFPKTKCLINVGTKKPDLLQLHNLHGGYFDLRLLPKICVKQPVNITLHDEWMYTGHCGYASNCQRWQLGCGECPDLESYPAIRVDNTINNHQFKKNIYKQSKFYVITPSEWLMKRVKNSVLANSIIDSKVINNGVDIDIFKVADRDMIRKRLNIDVDAFVGLFVANHFYTSKAKDFNTVLVSMRKLAENNKSKEFILIAIGEALGSERNDNLKIITLPFLTDRHKLAAYYQSADTYLHAAWTEVWGLTITEAMACGLPIIATATGGIPEQVKNLSGLGLENYGEYSREVATGILVQEGNSNQMHKALSSLLHDQSIRRQLGDNSLSAVKENYSNHSMIEKYMDWYSNILSATRH